MFEFIVLQDSMFHAVKAYYYWWLGHVIVYTANFCAFWV